MIGDGVLAQEESSTNLAIRHAISSKLRGLPLLCGQLSPGLDRALAYRHAGGRQLVRARSANASLPINVNWS